MHVGLLERIFLDPIQEFCRRTRRSRVKMFSYRYAASAGARVATARNCNAASRSLSL
jgi:hypothetical protein